MKTTCPTSQFIPTTPRINSACSLGRMRGLPLLSVAALLVAAVSSKALAQPYSIWNDSAVPAVLEAADPSSVELGVKFRSAVDGNITGIRFYKGAANTGTHVGNLWTVDGTLLATVEFTNETASGWQQQALPPVAIEANTTYVVSYHAPNGMYSVNGGYFASSGVDNPPLRALAEGEDGPNGLYAYGVGNTFPNQSFNSANYWVDVVFTPEVTGCAGDTNPPVVTAPRDVLFACADCNLDPANTGIATVTDECTFAVSYHDVVSGDCPKVVKRTWVAVDGAGNTNCATQTITCLPAALVTDSGGCSFDRDQDSDAAEFRLIFTADSQNPPCYRITASNPGQFLFHAFYTGDPGEQVTLDLTLPYPFVTKGARPVHAYDWVNVDIGDTRQCLSPGNEIFVGSQQVTLASYAALSNTTTTLPVSLQVPDSGVVFVTVHLDYGLKKTTGYQRNDAGDALDCATGTSTLVPNHHDYVFSVGGDATGSASIQNINAFMQNSGLGKLRIQNPQLKSGLAKSAEQFGFTVTGPEAQGFVIETCTDLSQPVWTPVETNAISGGSYDFMELRRTDSPSRYYRVNVP